MSRALNLNTVVLARRAIGKNYQNIVGVLSVQIYKKLRPLVRGVKRATSQPINRISRSGLGKTPPKLDLKVTYTSEPIIETLFANLKWHRCALVPRDVNSGIILLCWECRIIKSQL